MSASSPDHPSASARLALEGKKRRFSPEALALGKVLSALLYPISFGLIATWVIGVFFGCGFFLLIHHPEKPLSRLNLGKPSLGALLDESPWLLHVMTNIIQLGSEPFDISVRPPGVVTPSEQREQELEPELPARSKAGSDRGGIGVEGGAPSVDLATNVGAVDAAAPLAQPPYQFSASIDPPPGAQSAHDRPDRRRRQRRSAEIRTPQTHAPVQAIQDVLRKRSALLR